MIDYGSSPPIPAFKPPQREHLANYRRVYGASEAAVQEAQDSSDDPLADWLATYERLGAEHVVVKARDLARSMHRLPPRAGHPHTQTRLDSRPCVRTPPTRARR